MCPALSGAVGVAKPAKYSFDIDGDGFPDVEHTTDETNEFASAVTGYYDKLSTSNANGWNVLYFGPSVPTLTVMYNNVVQKKTLKLGDATAYDYIVQLDKAENPVTVNGIPRIITGSLLEEISPETLIEGWNYWYAATPDNYWDWGIILADRQRRG